MDFCFRHHVQQRVYVHAVLELLLHTGNIRYMKDPGYYGGEVALRGVASALDFFSRVRGGGTGVSTSHGDMHDGRPDVAGDCYYHARQNDRGNLTHYILKHHHRHIHIHTDRAEWYTSGIYYTRELYRYSVISIGRRATSKSTWYNNAHPEQYCTECKGAVGAQNYDKVIIANSSASVRVSSCRALFMNSKGDH